MALSAGVGASYEEDSFLAGATACQDAVGRLGGQKLAAVIVFASSKYDQQEVVRGVRSVSKEAVLIGSSTAGEITTEGPLQKNSVAVMAIASEAMKFFAASGGPISGGSEAAGKMVATKVKELAGGEALKAFIMLPDALSGNGSEIVRGVLDVMGEHFLVVGGASGDDFQFKKTYQYLNDTAQSDSIVGMGLGGEFKIGIGVKHGWIPLGTSMKVTKSSGNVIHEVDGKPAISIYEEYFGEQEAAALKTETLAKLAITYPLGLQVAGSDELLIRDPLMVDEKGSITCAADVPEGSEVRLMVGSTTDAIKAATEAAKMAMEQLEGTPPKAIIIFNCIARSRLFGERGGEEISAIQEVIGRDVPLIGFYTYGEQAPINGEVRDMARCNPAFHNETVVITVLG